MLELSVQLIHAVDDPLESVIWAGGYFPVDHFRDPRRVVPGLRTDIARPVPRYVRTQPGDQLGWDRLAAPHAILLCQ